MYEVNYNGRTSGVCKHYIGPVGRPTGPTGCLSKNARLVGRLGSDWPCQPVDRADRADVVFTHTRRTSLCEQLFLLSYSTRRTVMPNATFSDTYVSCTAGHRRLWRLTIFCHISEIMCCCRNNHNNSVSRFSASFYLSGLLHLLHSQLTRLLPNAERR